MRDTMRMPKNSPGRGPRLARNDRISRRQGLGLAGWLLGMALAAPGAGASIEALWQAGDGAFEDPVRWIFSEPPASATIPANDGQDSFRVRLDSDPGVVSVARLSSNVSIDVLEIGMGDTLELMDGSRLEIARGVLLNDGILRIEGDPLTDSGGELVFEQDLRLEGSGELRLAGGRVSAGIPTTGRLFHGAGHAITGTGVVDIGALPFPGGQVDNHGRFEASSGDSLEIAGQVTNVGELVASGGSLQVRSSVLPTTTNLGLISASSGGRVSIPWRRDS